MIWGEHNMLRVCAYMFVCPRICRNTRAQILPLCFVPPRAEGEAVHGVRWKAAIWSWCLNANIPALKSFIARRVFAYWWLRSTTAIVKNPQTHTLLTQTGSTHTFSHKHTLEPRMACATHYNHYKHYNLSSTWCSNMSSPVKYWVYTVHTYVWRKRVFQTATLWSAVSAGG